MMDPATTNSDAPTSAATQAAALAELRERLELVRGAIVEVEAEKTAATRAAYDAFSHAITEANGRHAASLAPLRKIEAALAAQLEAAKAASDAAELTELRGLS